MDCVSETIGIHVVQAHHRRTHGILALFICFCPFEMKLSKMFTRCNIILTPFRTDLHSKHCRLFIASFEVREMSAISIRRECCGSAIIFSVEAKPVDYVISVNRSNVALFRAACALGDAHIHVFCCPFSTEQLFRSTICIMIIVGNKCLRPKMPWIEIYSQR